jgi:hypothetical protein
MDLSTIRPPNIMEIRVECRIDATKSGIVKPVLWTHQYNIFGAPLQEIVPTTLLPLKAFIKIEIESSLNELTPSQEAQKHGILCGPTILKIYRFPPNFH